MGLLYLLHHQVFETAGKIPNCKLHIMNIQTVCTRKASSPCTGPDRSLDFQDVEAPRISTQLPHEIGKAFSFLIGPLSPPGNIPGTLFC
jgi:hypothetical protein